jgi:hypothetical protein
MTGAPEQVAIRPHIDWRGRHYEQARKHQHERDNLLVPLQHDGFLSARRQQQAMPPLDPKEEAIVVACVRNGGNQSAAWKECHPESKAQPATIHAKASKFFAQDKVRIRLAELHSEVANKLSDDAALSIEQHMAKLGEMRDRAISLNQMGAAIKAEQLRGELRRFYVKQVESKHVDEFAHMTMEELRAFVYGDQSGKGETKH